jgi:AraC family transcriptional regulator of adaptative response/methylated-DNA-[protein]-cysteine methyltransferase
MSLFPDDDPGRDLPADAPERARAYALVARAAERLRQGGDDVSLAALAAGAGYSPGHFQRLFAHWMGVSPKRYQQHLAGRLALSRLRAGDGLLEAGAAAGLSGQGRLHDLVVTIAAATPGEVRSGGAGLDLYWGSVATPFGPAFLAAGARGLARLSFLPDTGAGALQEALAEFDADWPRATPRRDDAACAAMARRLFDGYRRPEPVHLFVRGSQFQLRVWEALLRIPEGALTTYGELAATLGQPGAGRAVGTAVGANPVALLIPCHRVIRANGDAGGYRWGMDRKRLLLSAEIAWHEAPDAVAGPATA